MESGGAGMRARMTESDGIQARPLWRESRTWCLAGSGSGFSARAGTQYPVALSGRRRQFFSHGILFETESLLAPRAP